MKTIKFTLIFLLLLILTSNKLVSQPKPGDQPLIDKISIGANFGSCLAYGDIKEYNFWPAPAERKWGFGFNINYQISPIVSIQGQVVAGKLAGIKRNFANGDVANLKFNADFNEGDLVATISLNRWWAPNLKINDKINLYFLAGVGLMNFRTQLRGLYDDHFINSHGYSANGTKKESMTTETSFPAGLGIKYKASKKIDISLEATIRYVVTDKLDAYERPTNFNDKWGYTFIGVTYKLGKQEKHMEWMEPKDVEKDNSKLALDEINKKIDDLNKKIAELQNKQTPVNNDEQKFTAVNQKIDDLAKKVNELPSGSTGTNTGNTGNGGNVDLQKLNDLNQKLTDLDNKNKELGNKIINMQTTTNNVTYTGGKPILVSVFFGVNKTNIDKINGERIAAAAKYLLSDPNAKLDLIGNADKSGGQQYNILLSERRAKAVQQVLVKEYGIDASRLAISFKGFSEPLSKTNYDVNRRVDFVIK